MVQHQFLIDTAEHNRRILVIESRSYVCVENGTFDEIHIYKRVNKSPTERRIIFLTSL